MISKDEHIRAIRNVGFRDVSIVDESHYIELLSDPVIRTFIKKFNVLQEVLEEIDESTVSIKVHGKK